MMFSDTTLENAASILIGKVGSASAGFMGREPHENAFAWISAGDGEIQVSQDGAWWFKFDRTHAVDAEKELEVPPGIDGMALAAWMMAEANKFW